MNCDVEKVRAEFLWQQHWKRRDKDDRPQIVLDAIREAREAVIVPAVTTLLHIFATFPVTMQPPTSDHLVPIMKYKELPTFHHDSWWSS